MPKVNELLALYKSLPPKDRKDFVARINTNSQFNLNGWLASQNKGKVECPHCSHTKVVKFGVRRGIQWFKCKDCEKTFSHMTGTILSSTKKDFQTWKTFVGCMIDGRSVRDSANICEINRNTAFAWRHKILDALAQYHERQLPMKGIVEADDTFFNISFKGGNPIDREAHKRGTRAVKKGISKEQVCVSCAVDRKGHVYSKVSTLGRPTAKVLRKVFRKRFSKQNSVIFCTDKDTAYAKFASAKDNFRHIKLKRGGATSIQGQYHVQNINAYHSRLKHFLRRFKGVSTKYLNNYLVWNNVIQEKRIHQIRIILLKLCMRAKGTTRCCDISHRPAIPSLE